MYIFSPRIFRLHSCRSFHIFSFLQPVFSFVYSVPFESEMPTLWATTVTNNVVYRNIFFSPPRILSHPTNDVWTLFGFFFSYPMTRFFFYPYTDFPPQKMPYRFICLFIFYTNIIFAFDLFLKNFFHTSLVFVKLLFDIYFVRSKYLVLN